MIVSASILNADILQLRNEIKNLENAGTDHIHIDVMDGRFVQATTYGENVVAAIKDVTNLPIEVHLMIQRPEIFIERFIEVQPNIIFIHPESSEFVRHCLLKIKSAGLKAGIALKLDTPLQIDYYLDLVDVVLLVTCDEGFGGNPFQTISLKKIVELKKIREDGGFNFMIEVDGGINEKTAGQCKEAGADILVSGSYILNYNPQESIEKLKNI